MVYLFKSFNHFFITITISQLFIRPVIMKIGFLEVRSNFKQSLLLIPAKQKMALMKTLASFACGTWLDFREILAMLDTQP